MNDAASPSHPVSHSLWRRLRKTPLRDALRLRFSGRLDVDRLVAESNLPGPASELIRAVIRKSRLSRFEKVDVAAELIGHFRDGLEADESPEALVDRFGTAERAAALIRRAKMRARPLPYQIYMRTLKLFIGLIALITLLYVAQAIRVFSAKPNIRTDYLAPHQQAALAVLQEDRAWPIYHEALVTIEEMPKELQGERPLPGDYNWGEYAAYLERNKASLDLLRSVSGKTHLGYVVDYKYHPEDLPLFGPVEEQALVGDYKTKSVIEVWLPHLGPIRRASLLLAGDMHCAALLEDGEQVMANARALLAMGRHVSDTPFLISNLVAYAVWAQAFEHFSRILVQQPELFTDDQLQEFAHEVAALGDGGRFALNMQSERAFFLDVLQRLYTDDGSGGGYMTAEGVRLLSSITGSLADPSQHRWLHEALTPGLTIVVADRKQMLEKYDELLAMYMQEAAKPLHERQVYDTFDTRVERLYASPVTRLRFLPIGVLMPALGRVSLQTDLIEQRRDALLVAIALEMYRREHDSYPASLTALTPSLLPAVPIDIYDGQSLRYLVGDDGTPIVYSVGPDGDDDGGRRPDSDRSRITLGIQDADDDWVIYPPAPHEAVLREAYQEGW